MLPVLKASKKMEIINIKKMDITSRLQTMEAIWNSFMDEETEIQSPDWHNDILDERKTKIQEGQAEFISIQELKLER
jgi:hypothetical protein